jgi:hypothetical protein
LELRSIDGSNFGYCQRNEEEKEICRALSQPLQALWPAARVSKKIPALPDLLPAVVAFG